MFGRGGSMPSGQLSVGRIEHVSESFLCVKSQGQKETTHKLSHGIILVRLVVRPQAGTTLRAMLLPQSLALARSRRCGT